MPEARGAAVQVEARRKVRLQVRLGLNPKRNCKAPARDRAHLGRGCFSTLDRKGRGNRLKVTRLVSGRVGTRIPNSWWWGAGGRMRPVGNFQIRSHRVHGERESTLHKHMASTTYYYTLCLKNREFLKCWP